MLLYCRRQYYVTGRCICEVLSDSHRGGATVKAHFETGAQPQPRDELKTVYTAKEITLELARWAAAGEIGSAQPS